MFVLLLMSYDIDDIIGDMPMHYTYFRKEKGCRIPDQIIEDAIPDGVKKASSFEELFNELNEMVINLEANPLVKRAQITIDVPDDVASDSPDVVLNVNVKERHGSLANVVFETAADHDDYSLGIQHAYVNPTKHLDMLSTRFTYDLIGGGNKLVMQYFNPVLLFGRPFRLSLSHEAKNRVKDSGVTVYSDSAVMSFPNRSSTVVLDAFVRWRDMSPFGDIDEERILNSHCGSAMLSECKPSLACGYTLHLQHSTLRDPIPTHGHRVHCSLVRRPPSLTTRQTYNGLCGDVNSLRAEGSLELHKPLSRDLVEETGLVMHLAATGGCVVNLNRRKTRYFDRFFLNGTNVHGFTRGDFGPRSAAEGSRRNGDLLGGDCCLALAAGLSLPVVVSQEYSYGIRAKLFYEVGNVWNLGDHLKSVWKKAKQSYGVGVVLPFLGKGVLELDYLINQKRFTFSASF